MWTRPEFPFLLDEIVFKDHEEIAEEVLYLMNLKPLFRFSEDIVSVADSIKVLDIFKMSEIGYGLMMKKMMPTYDNISFFKEYFPKYDYTNGAVKEMVGDAVTNTVMDNQRSFGRKDLTYEEVFGMEDGEGEAIEQRSEDGEPKKVGLEADGATPKGDLLGEGDVKDDT